AVPRFLLRMRWFCSISVALGASLAIPVGAQDTEVIAAKAAREAPKTIEPTQSPAAAPAIAYRFNPSSGRRGTQGAHRVEAAHALYPGRLVLSLSANYAVADGMFVGGDTNEWQQQALSLVWALPWVPGLELHLNQSSTTNTYA